jgi:electron transfer flavoprotein beta subunit
VKWVDLRPEIDPLTGVVTPSAHGGGFSAADLAALELAIAHGERVGTPVVAITYGSAESLTAMEALAASGAREVIVVEGDARAASADVGAALAGVLEAAGSVAAVYCGDASLDRGSGAVPGFVAHHLGVAAALGVVSVEVGETAHEIRCIRRLGGGHGERLALREPFVVSVEGCAAGLRRAPLTALLGDGRVPVRVVAAPSVDAPHTTALAPRPRTRIVAGPTAPTALGRIEELTGAHVERVPPRLIEAGPAEAAAAILEQLAAWGYR